MWYNEEVKHVVNGSKVVVLRFEPGSGVGWGGGGVRFGLISGGSVDFWC